MAPRILQVSTNHFWTGNRTREAQSRARNLDTTELLDLMSSGKDRISSEISREENGTNPKRADSASNAGPILIRQFKRRITGWRCGALMFAICTSVVFCLNLIVTIWGFASYNSNNGVLREGDCGDIQNLNSGLHMVINVFSTVLLSGSNYCMQCLSAPTRKDINQAHAKGKWLDIGISSFRNLQHISPKRLLLWFLLGISSLPLHLL